LDRFLREYSSKNIQRKVGRKRSKEYLCCPIKTEVNLKSESQETGHHKSSLREGKQLGIDGRKSAIPGKVRLSDSGNGINQVQNEHEHKTQALVFIQEPKKQKQARLKSILS
jgi:hypothetical protein